VAVLRPAPRQEGSALAPESEVPTVRAHGPGERAPPLLVGALGDFEALVCLPLRVGVLESGGRPVVLAALARALQNPSAGGLRVEAPGEPLHGRALCGLGLASRVERQDSDLHGDAFEERGFDRLAGRARGDPDLVGQRERHVVL